jgi:hypothetical protein
MRLNHMIAHGVLVFETLNVGSHLDGSRRLCSVGTLHLGIYGQGVAELIQ